MIDINKMRRLAQAATPGPWTAAGPSFGESLPKYLNEVVIDREGDEDDGYSICAAPIGLNEECSDDMAFIAEANPLTIEELLDRIEAAEKEVESLRQGIAFRDDVVATLAVERDALRTALEKIADWDSAWGPYPETNEAWRAMAVVTAREAVPRRGE